MAETEITHKWIEEGYKLFSVVGPNEFKVEKLATQIGLNKSGFYHYFVDRDTFYSELMKYHDQMGIKFAQELSKLKNFMPDYLQLLVSYQTALHVQMHLRKNHSTPLFREYFFKVKKRNYQYQIPLWAKFIQISDMNLATELFEIAVDLMVVRIQDSKITYDYLEGLFNGIKQTVDKLRIKK